MHDPMTVAFDIRSPFYKTHVMKNGMKLKERNTWLTIWHNDPESDGSDDSCGWAFPKLSEHDKKIVNEMVEWDLQFPFFSSDFTVNCSVVIDLNYDYRRQTPADCMGMVAAAWQMISWQRDHRRKLTAGEWWRVVSLATNPMDNLQSILASSERSGKERAQRFLWCVMMNYLHYHRPWYKHPRWHIWHWSVQIQPIGNLKRWLFSRCEKCGKRFRWGYAPTVSGWNHKGPGWFRPEQGAYHSECYEVRVKE